MSGTVATSHDFCGRSIELQKLSGTPIRCQELVGNPSTQRVYVVRGLSGTVRHCQEPIGNRQEPRYVVRNLSGTTADPNLRQQEGGWGVG